jgi:hypothetical protein
MSYLTSLQWHYASPSQRMFQCYLSLLLPLTSVDPDALARSVISRSSTRAHFVSQTTTSTTFSASLSLEKVLRYGTIPTRISFIMPIRFQYTLTTTTLVASHYSKRWLRAVLVSRLMYTWLEATFWLDTHRMVCIRRTTCGQCT